MLGVTALAVITAPAVAVGLVAADLLGRRPKLPKLRVHLIVLQYLVNDSVEILAAPLLWIAAGFGRRIDTRASQARHQRLQRWSLDLLARRAETLLGLRLDIRGADATDGLPAIVLVRHVSLVDASLPPLVFGPAVAVRGVIMKEMLADPGFDLLYARLGSVFVDRSDPSTAAQLIAAMGSTLDRHSVGVIYPEGRLSDDAARQRAIARLENQDPERGARLAGLRHLLPPRPAGTLALLDAAPHADVVVIGHVGLETVPRLSVLLADAPLDHPIAVRLQRIGRREIPEDRDDRIRWLDELWLGLDQWIDDEHNRRRSF